MRSMLLDAANDWEWIDKAPAVSEPPIRIRWITREEARRLLRALDEDCMRVITAFGFATGLRQRNILRLEWTQVDLVARRTWTHPDQAKARKPIGVPLNDESIALLRRQIGQHRTFIFVRDGSPLEK
jgi:integrase